MEVCAPSPLPLQPGMITGFEPPGQPTPPILTGTSGGARVTCNMNIKKAIRTF
jgi:hypothetical protein